MKKILLILIAICGSTSVYCQSLKPDVFTTAGNFNVNADNSVSWTIGECISETFSNAGNKLTQGFQQGIYEITAIDNTRDLIKITLFPNPATDYINLEIELQDNHELSYKLYDLNGRCFKIGKIISAKSEINLAGYSGNTCILNVYSADKKLLKSFKILKIN